MTKPSVYTAHDVSDLINTLPTMFGFRPDESIVAVATHGPRRRFGFRLRMDIPPRRHVGRAAVDIVGHLVRQGAEGAIVIAVTRRQGIALKLLDAIHRELDDAGVELIVRARADGERYWTDESFMPAEGVPYETSDHHLAIVHAVAAGQQILPDRQALVDRFRPVSGDRRRWLEHAAAAVLDEVMPQVARTPEGQLASTGMAIVRPILDRALAEQTLTEAELLTFSAWVSAVPVRDEVWGLMTRDNAPQMLRALTVVSGSVVPPFEPAVLSLAAFAAWLRGDGAQALIAVQRALAVDPCYSMALLMLQILEAGVSPENWQGFSAAA